MCVVVKVSGFVLIRRGEACRHESVMKEKLLLTVPINIWHGWPKPQGRVRR